MPKIKVNAFMRAAEFKQNGLYATDSTTLFCKPCNRHIPAYIVRDSIAKHVRSASHLAAQHKQKEAATIEVIDLESGAGPSRQSSLKTIWSDKHRKQAESESFAEDVVRTWMKCNIALEKLELECLRNFFDKYIEGAGNLPNVDLLRTKYVQKIADERVSSVKAVVANKALVVHCDETTDDDGKCVFNILFKPLEASSEMKVYVGDVAFLTSADSSTCSKAILKAMTKYEIEFDNVTAFASDSARYMTKCFKNLREIIGNHVLVVQCWAHKLNIICDIIMKQLQALNSAVSNVKNGFKNTRKRLYLYKAHLVKKHSGQDSNLFPMPVLTRWSSWFRSVFYLVDHFDDIVKFFKSPEMSNTDNAGIHYISNLNVNETDSIKTQTIFVKEHCEEIVKTITELEGAKYPTSCTLVSKLEQFENNLSFARRKIFLTDTYADLSKISNHVEKAKVEETLKSAANLALVKLNALKLDDTNFAFYTTLNVLGPLKIVNATVDTKLCKSLQELPFLSTLKENDVLKGLKSYQREVLKQVVNIDKINVINCLLSLSERNFAVNAVKLLWIPCSNVDSERFFSSYGNILTDKRHNLSEHHRAIMSSIYYEA